MVFCVEDFRERPESTWDFVLFEKLFFLYVNRDYSMNLLVRNNYHIILIFVNQLMNEIFKTLKKLIGFFKKKNPLAFGYIM